MPEKNKDHRHPKAPPQVPSGPQALVIIAEGALQPRDTLQHSTTLPKPAFGLKLVQADFWC